MQLLSELVGRKVTVFSMQGDAERQDVGLLEAADERWLKVRKTETELLYFNTRLVRVLKPFDSH